MSHRLHSCLDVSRPTSVPEAVHQQIVHVKGEKFSLGIPGAVRCTRCYVPVTPSLLGSTVTDRPSYENPKTTLPRNNTPDRTRNVRTGSDDCRVS